MKRSHTGVVAVLLSGSFATTLTAQVAVTPNEPVSLEGAIVVRLSVAPPEMQLRWSPKGAQIQLAAHDDGTLFGEFLLGFTGTQSIAVSLSRSIAGGPVDRLTIDLDRDGDLSDETVLVCKPTEQRGKTWSSFSAEVPDPVVDPWGVDASIPYRINLWYVADPLEPNAPPLLRWSRRSFFTGTCVLDGVESFVMVCERDMDGVVDRRDSWALAPMDDAAPALGMSRDLDDHAWLGERAYKVAAIDASGLLAVVVPHDPIISRAEEEHQRDALAGDRAATRSGGSVAFLHDYESARSASREQGKMLFVDFEAEWCGPCKQMDALVYTADDVVKVATHVVAVKVDGDVSRDLVKQFDVRGYPTLILLDPSGNEIARHVGYMGVKDTAAFFGLAPR